FIIIVSNVGIFAFFSFFVFYKTFFSFIKAFIR
ncbi:hypothetical protein SAMN05444373_11061, partial [Thermoclostridium caenicola]